MTQDFEAVIGLEVHTQLATQSKLFCNCSTQFGAEANHQTCPVCLGLPGSLPVLNRYAFDLGIKAALALNCQIAKRLKFDRKNYFYPDLPKAYQISQFDKPLSFGGYLDIVLPDGQAKKVGITRAHLEEDAGKLLHDASEGASLVDYNRGGTPLLEIVSEPDIRSPEEAYIYLNSLKTILEYANVSDCNMEEGSLRCDANVSVRPRGQKEFGIKVEVKNLNSFKAVAKSIQYEIDRQIQAIADGETIRQETRLWNDGLSKTLPMRSKEQAHDYRYFPEPDLVPFTVSEEEVKKVLSQLGERPWERLKRLQDAFQLPLGDAQQLVLDKKLGDFFEACMKYNVPGKRMCNWVLSELMGRLNERQIRIQKSPITSEALAELVQLIENNTISGKIGKNVLDLMFETGKSAVAVVEEKGLKQVTDTGEIETIVSDVIKQNPKPVADFQSGEMKAIGFLVGQVMKASKGKANPGLVNKILQEKLKK